jgi:RecA/RadA recombinase
MLTNPFTGRFTHGDMTEGHQPSELVMAKLEAVEMQTLHGLDELPIAQDEDATQLGKIVSSLSPVGLVAVIIAAVFVASTTAPVPSPNTAREEPRELVDRLLREVEALKSENRKLTDAQQRPSGVSSCAIAWH